MARLGSHARFRRVLYYRDAFFEGLVAGEGRTIEVGCGEGRVARDLAVRGHDVVAVDLTAALLEHARKTDPDLLYARADAAALPFRNGSFDTVVAYNSVMDIEGMPYAVGEAARVLKASGHFCMCVVHPCVMRGRSRLAARCRLRHLWLLLRTPPL